MKWNNKRNQSIQNTAGETLIETLLASLFIALAMVSLSSMILASQTILKTGDETLEKFYQNVNAMEEATSITTGSSGATSDKIQIQTGIRIKIESNNLLPIQIPVTFSTTDNSSLKFYIKQ